MKKIIATFIICLTAAGLSHGSVVFQDDFNTDGDLSQWDHPNKTLLVSRGDIEVTGGQLFMSGPNGTANGDNIFDAVLRSVDTFNFTGAFSMSFDLQHDIRTTAGRESVRVYLPGGLEMRWRDFNNSGRLYYQGDLLGSLDNGAWLDEAPRSFTMAQDGLNVEVFKNGASIFNTTVAAAPDFDTGFQSQITLFSKFHGDGPTVIDNVSVIPEPSTFALLALTGAACVMFRKRKKG